MKNIILLWWLLGVTGTTCAQTVIIKDQETSQPLKLVSLMSKNPSVFVTTNAEGQASITAFKDTDAIEIRLLGYMKLLKSFKEIESDGFVVWLKTTDFNLDEVVVSATRWNQTSDNVPSKIISISAKDVALQNPQTAADLLNISGKVFVQKSQQGGGSPMIRGFATNRLIYTVDGVRMNTAIFRGGNLQNVINLDPFATEKTEVLFGPGAVIYGSDAIGGVMSFQTLTPQLSHSDEPLIAGKTQTRYSSVNNERTGHFDINIGWKRWALVTSFSAWDFDHLRQGSNGPVDYLKSYYVQRQDSTDRLITQEDPLLQIPSAYSQVNIMQKVRFRANEKWDFQYGFHFSETSPYGRYDRHNRLRNGTARYADWNYGPQKWMMNNMSITHVGGKAFYDQVTLRAAQQSFEESRVDRSLNNSERTTNTEQVDAYSVNLDFAKSTSSRHTFFYGLEYVLNDVNSKGLATDISTGETTVGSSRYPSSTWNSIGMYINDAFELSDQFTLQAGVRYNKYDLNANFSNNLDFYPFPFRTAEISNNAITGSIGGVYRPSESWVISTNFGTAFRSPNVDDVGKVFDSEPGAVTVPNPNLKAEYAYNVDFGIAKIFGEVVKIDVSGYYTRLQDAMVRRNFQLNGQENIQYDGQLSQVQAIQNAAKAMVYGVQAGIEIELLAGFSFSSDINYQQGEEELDNGETSDSRHVAPLFGVSRLNFKARDLRLLLYSTYQDERKFEDLAVSEQGKDEIYAQDSNGNNFSPSWYTLNIKAMYDLTETFSISTGIENLSDQRYRPYSSGISEGGRNFTLAARANF